MRTYIPLMLLPALCATMARAETGALDEIVVTATRTAQPVSAIGQSISVIDEGMIALRQSTSVVDLLRDLPGVAFSRTGGPGTLTSVFVRGANADQTTVLIDGVKLNDPSSTAGGFSFGDLMTGNVQRIELLRGPQSVLWGSQSIGGVVNLISKEPTEQLALNLRGEYGWRDSANLVGNASGKAGPVSASFGGGYYRTDGISTLDRRYGGIERDGYRNYGANAKVKVALSEAVSVDLRGWYARGTAQDDDVFSLADSADYLRTRQMVGYAALNAALLDGRFRNRLAYAHTDVRRHSESMFGASDFEGRNARFEYQGELKLAEGWQATFGLERETQRSDSFDGSGVDPRARTDSAYGLLILHPREGLTLSAGARHDHHSDFGGHESLGASAAWSPDGGATVLRASYADGFKAPSLYQLNGPYGGNLGLKPEIAHGWDAGVTRRFVDGRIELGLTYYRRTTRNQIDYVDGGYVNFARTLAKGVEATLAATPVEGLTLSASLTHGSAEDRAADSANYGKQLPRRPRDMASGSIDYRWPFALETGASLRYVGKRRDIAFDADFNAYDVTLGSYALVDLRARYPLGDGIELFGRVENLFDTHYETVLYYGAPGRAALAGVRLSY